MAKYMVAFKRTATVSYALDAENEEKALEIANKLMASDYRYEIIDDFCSVMDWDYDQEVLYQLDDVEEELCISPNTVAEYIGEE